MRLVTRCDARYTLKQDSVLICAWLKEMFGWTEILPRFIDLFYLWLLKHFLLKWTTSSHNFVAKFLCRTEEGRKSKVF